MKFSLGSRKQTILLLYVGQYHAVYHMNNKG